jgi:hypothetical protein
MCRRRMPAYTPRYPLHRPVAAISGRSPPPRPWSSPPPPPTPPPCRQVPTRTPSHARQVRLRLVARTQGRRGGTGTRCKQETSRRCPGEKSRAERRETVAREIACRRTTPFSCLVLHRLCRYSAPSAPSARHSREVGAGRRCRGDHGSEPQRTRVRAAAVCAVSSARHGSRAGGGSCTGARRTLRGPLQGGEVGQGETNNTVGRCARHCEPSRAR